MQYLVVNVKIGRANGEKNEEKNQAQVFSHGKKGNVLLNLETYSHKNVKKMIQQV